MPELSSSRAFALLVTRNFPPLLGGMEKVNQQLLEALQPSWCTALCGPAGCGQHAPAQTEVLQSRVKPLPMFLVSTMWHAVRVALRRRPEWVIAGSGLTAPIAWFAARLVGGRAAVYLHGLDVVAPNLLYQWLWLPFIRRCDLAIVNSESTATLARNRRVPIANTHILHPGTDLPMLDGEAALNFRRRYGFGQRPLLLTVGRLTQRKGLVEFVSKSLPTITAHRSDVMLVVIGDEASDALHARAGSERERILSAAQSHGVEQNLCFLGRCDDGLLGAAYQAANIHVFPVLELPGDVEGFGMVALESAAHGLSTIAFAVGGVPDAVSDGETGILIEPGDYVAFANAILRLLALARGNENTLACRDFASRKAWPVFAKRLRHLLELNRA